MARHGETPVSQRQAAKLSDLGGPGRSVAGIWSRFLGPHDAREASTNLAQILSEDKTPWRARTAHTPRIPP